MRIHISQDAGIPIYRQIVEQVRDSIDAGVHRPGEALPSLRALAVEIRVNPNTVQRAYEELEREGLVESRRGRGVFVVESMLNWEQLGKQVGRELVPRSSGNVNMSLSPSTRNSSRRTPIDPICA